MLNAIWRDTCASLTRPHCASCLSVCESVCLSRYSS